jgi:hypothetical protein
MATWGKHGLHPVAKRPKTATEKLKDHLADGGEEYASGARGKLLLYWVCRRPM